MMYNEKEMEQILMDALNNYNDDTETNTINNSITYEDAGLLTTDNGIIVKMMNGQKFQITIVQSI